MIANLTVVQITKPRRTKKVRAKKNLKINAPSWQSLPLGETVRSGEACRVGALVPAIAKIRQGKLRPSHEIALPA
jgi:hypothetical protein